MSWLIADLAHLQLKTDRPASLPHLSDGVHTGAVN